MKRKKRIGTVGKAIGCLFFLMVSLFPIYWLVAMAIRPTDEMRGHIALIPQSLTGIHRHHQQLADYVRFSVHLAGCRYLRGLYHRPPPVPVRPEKAHDILGPAGARAAAGGLHHPAVHHVQ